MSSSNKHRKYLAATIGTAIVASSVTTVLPYNVLNVEAASFPDVVDQGAYYYEAVYALTESGVIKGLPDGTFAPDKETTRAEASVMIARALNLDGMNSPDPSYKDVHKGSYYYEAVAALTEAGIVNGVAPDSYAPDQIITRAEIAKMLVEAYDLKQNAENSSVFTDVPANIWYAEYVKALSDSGVTNGTSPTTFAPNVIVQRAQMATFIYRAQQTKGQVQTIESVTDSTVVIDGKSYSLSVNMKKLFNSVNAAVLKNAVIQFEQSNGTVTKVKHLEITANGKAASAGQAEQSGHLVLDGKNGAIDGSVVINGDYVTVKNLTVKEDFTIGIGVQNSFLMDNLVVEGTTTVAENDTQAASITNDTSMKAAAKMKVKIIFTNSMLKVVQINKNDVDVESKGNTKLLEIKVASNAKITADSTVKIPKITLQIGSQEVEINAKVQELVIDSEDAITISGEATLDKVKISTSASVNLNTTGEIKKLESTNKDAQITIKEGTKVGNVVVPKGSNVSDIIQNFDNVKGNIEQIGGKENPDFKTPPPPPPPPIDDDDDDETPPPPPIDRTAPRFIGEPTVTPGGDKGELDIKVNLDESGTVYYVVVPHGTTPEPSAANVRNATGSNTGSITVSDRNVIAEDTIEGLETNGVQYDVYLVARDTTGNLQTTPKKISSVTAAGVTGSITSVDQIGDEVEIYVSDGDYINSVPNDRITITVDTIPKGTVELIEEGDTGVFKGTLSVADLGLISLNTSYDDLSDSKGLPNNVTFPFTLSDQVSPKVTSLSYTLEGSGLVELVNRDTIDTLELSSSDISKLTNLSFAIKDHSNVTVSANASIWGYTFSGSKTLSPNEQGEITYILDIQRINNFIHNLDLLDKIKANADESITIDASFVEDILSVLNPANPVNFPGLPGDSETISLDTDILKALITKDTLWNEIADEVGTTVSVDISKAKALLGSETLWSMYAGGEDKTITFTNEQIQSLLGSEKVIPVKLSALLTRPFTAKEVATIFNEVAVWAELDTNHDGEITLELAGIQSLFTSLVPSVTGKITVDRDTAISHYNKLFGFIDKDGNGKITINAETAQVFLSSLDLPTNIYNTERTINLTLTDDAGNSTIVPVKVKLLN